MAATIPTSEPTSARAGDTWTWARTDLTDYPASAWALVYALRNAAAAIDITATAQPDDSYLISVAPSVTATYTPGRFDWYAHVQQTEDIDGTPTVTARHQVASGQIQIQPDISAAVARDTRTWARRLLDAVEAALEARATADEIDLITQTVGDRTLTRDRATLLELRTKLLLEVQRTENTGGRPQRILVRFG